MIAFILLTLTFLFQNSGLIQEEYSVRNFTVEDGLPVNATGKMIQDDDGYIWILTLDGLVRYDGYEFRVYNSVNTNGLHSNRISHIVETGKNEFWLRHDDGALTYRNGARFTSYSVNLKNLSRVAESIATDGKGRFWMSSGESLFFFNEQNQSFEKVSSPLLNTPISNIAETYDGQIVVWNKKGLILIEDMKPALLLNSNEVPDELQVKEATFIIARDRIWIHKEPYSFGYSLAKKRAEILLRLTSEKEAIFTNLVNQTTKQIIISDPVTPESLKNIPWVSQNELQKLLFQTNKIVYEDSLGSLKGGEHILLEPHQLYINGNRVLSAQGEFRDGFVDREGSIWISSRTNGLYQLRRSILSNINQTDISGFANIYSVIESKDGTITACGFTDDIFQIKGNEIKRWGSDNSDLQGHDCRSLFEDSDGAIYAGFWDETLWKFDRGKWHQLHIKMNDTMTNFIVEAMHIDNQGQFLVGTRNHLYVLEDDSLRFFSEKEDRFQGVRVIRENNRGDLYFGTISNGLFIYRKNGKTEHYSSSENQKFIDSIRDIYLQSADTLWLASENRGLHRLVLDEENHLFAHSVLTVSDGLINNSLHRIIATQDGYLWISSNGGIMRVSLDELNQYADGEIATLSILAVDESEGMINREANGGVQTAGLLSQDHLLWFPNQSGITVIDPVRTRKSEKIPLKKPVIEHISTGDSLVIVNHQKSIDLPLGRRNIRIKFTAPSFFSSDRIQFRYKLNGVNEDWQNGNQGREAVLTNLPPGAHQFQVIVFRNQNTNNVYEASVFINIPVYFYEAVWFKILLACLGVLVLLGGIKYRTRILEQRERQLQARVDKKTLQLQEAAEQKSRFFSGITHELKTPLSLIISPLEDILEESVDSETVVNERLRLMHQNSYQLKKLVDQILDVTKLNSDAITLTLQPVNIVELTRQLWGQFHSKFAKKRIKPVFEAYFIEELIYIDPSAWEHIINNLLTNAIKFSPTDSSIYVSIKDLGDRISLSIRDEGMGIEKEQHQKVFEYLYQVEGNNAAEGTGIGLYLVKGLAEQMGGEVQLISDKNKGAEFVVVLKKGFSHFKESDRVIHEPFLPDSSKVDLKEIKEENGNLPLAQSGKSARILIVEDNDDFRGYLHKIVSEKRYEVLTAKEGEEGLKVLQKEHIDLVISDVMMHGMNGFEFVQKLRSKETFKHLPVIFLSAKDEVKDMEKGLSTGADIYLTKPIKSSLLISQISAVLRREEVLKKEQLITDQTEETEFVKKIRQIIYRQLANPDLNINMLADSLFISRSTLYREWKKGSDITLNDFIRKLRLEEAEVLLTQKGFSVLAASKAVGYSDIAYFSTSFKKEFGVSPSEIKK